MLSIERINAEMIIVLCGKSACGKDTLLKELIKDGFEPLISTTSRPMREGEVDGREYYFISREEFKQRLASDRFIEYRIYHTLVNNIPDDWYYGMEKREFDPNKNYIVILDIEGTEAFKHIYGNQVFAIYIDAHDEQRTKWAQSRGSFDETEWNRRLADDNIKFSTSKVSTACDYTISNTGTFEELKNKFKKALDNLV